MNKIHIETYGCRMNICDSEIIMSLLQHSGQCFVPTPEEADIIILNSCSVREDGHNKIFERLRIFAQEIEVDKRSVIIAGCFASLIDTEVFSLFPFVKAIVNPNCYRLLPQIAEQIANGERKIRKIIIDNNEMYDDVLPLRYMEGQTTAAITVMKGCNQFCSYCIEPFTRGREHCREVDSILREAHDIMDNGYRELTLVGHIIDKYKWTNPKSGKTTDFAELLACVAESCPQLRIKFLSSHPISFNDAIVRVIASHPNIMHVVHLPLQSGSDRILEMMHRGYNVDDFRKRIASIRKQVPDMSIITDIMVGFCSESDVDFNATCQLIDELKFDDINIFRFSMRSHTKAAECYSDDVTEIVKLERADIIKHKKEQIRLQLYENEIKNTINVIAEGIWRDDWWYGRDTRHRIITFIPNAGTKINQNVKIKIKAVTADYMSGEVIE